VPYASAFETNWTLQLERGGWWVSPASSGEQFARVVLAAGGWVDPYVGAGRLRATIARHGGLRFVPPAVDAAHARLEDAPLRDAVPASIDRTLEGEAAPRSEWPLQLVAFTPAAVNLGGSLNQPALFELLGQPEGAPWRVWAEIHPDTARTLGIHHGSNIRITSPSGAIDASAVLVDGMAPGTIAAAFVPALGAGGRWARLVAADVRTLWGRRPRTEAIGVRVRPVRSGV
jgi:anaerobic selenocysteine-containing dehydrogenase